MCGSASSYTEAVTVYCWKSCSGPPQTHIQEVRGVTLANILLSPTSATEGLQGAGRPSSQVYWLVTSLSPSFHLPSRNLHKRLERPPTCHKSKVLCTLKGLRLPSTVYCWGERTGICTCPPPQSNQDRRCSGKTNVQICPRRQLPDTSLLLNLLHQWI